MPHLDLQAFLFDLSAYCSDICAGWSREGPPAFSADRHDLPAKSYKERQHPPTNASRARARAIRPPDQRGDPGPRSTTDRRDGTERRRRDPRRCTRAGREGRARSGGGFARRPIRPSARSSTTASTSIEEQKKTAETRKQAKIVEIKEIKMRPNIDDHDYDVKMRVDQTLLRGRRQGEGHPALPRPRNGAPAARHGSCWSACKGDLEPIAKVESEPRLEGRQMVMVLAPR